MKTIRLIIFFGIFSLSFAHDLSQSYSKWKDETVKVSKKDIYRQFPTEKEFQMYDKILRTRYDEADYQDYLQKNNLENRLLEAEIYNLYRKNYDSDNYYIFNNYYRRKRGY